MQDPSSRNFYNVSFAMPVVLGVLAAGIAVLYFVDPAAIGLILGGKGGSNMPVGVNGGAMTVHGQDWKSNDIEVDDGEGNPCIVLKPGIFEFFGLTIVEFEGVTDGEKVPKEKTDSMTTYRFLRSPWTIDLYVRNRDGRGPFDGGPDVPDGMQLSSTHKCRRQDGSTSDGVTVKINKGSSGTFYPFGDVSTQDKYQVVGLNEDGLTGRRRYMTNNPDCKTEPSSNGDRDICERLSSIFINEIKHPYTHGYHCTDGECRIGVEKF
jgi:hypothetical protein